MVAYETTNSCRDCNLSYQDYLDWKKTNTSFSSFEAWDASAMPAASAAIPRLFRLIPERRLRGMPYFRDAGLHPRVVVFSVTPVLRLSLSNLREDLAEGGRGSAGTLWKRFGSNLAAELAIAMVLLASAGLLGKSLYRMCHVDLNFNSANLATLEIDNHGAGYEKNDQLRTLYRRLVEHISAMPGVVSVAHTSDLPITCNCNPTEFRVLGHPWYGEHDKALRRDTSADYFKVLQARLIAGRFYTEADDSSKPRVAVVNRALAKQFFMGEDPVGRTIGDAELSPKSLAQVIGTVDDVREGGLVEPLVPALYYPFKQDTGGTLFLVVRTGQHPAPMMLSLVRAIHQVDPNLGVRNEFVMGRPDQRLAGGFPEPLIGVAGGRICGVPAARLLRGLLFGVQPWDVLTLIGVAVVLGICALVASYLPARRAASVNPVEALRAE
jgi:hypothetical protein